MSKITVEVAEPTRDEPVFACDMTAIEPAERKEHAENISQLFGLAKTIEERPDGYAVEFDLDSEILMWAVRFISLERLCCPFFGFRIELKPKASTFWLNLYGPHGIKPFIEAELGLKHQA
ncbi:MAG TPA: hypothetical protein VH186_16490 [Chloroflexia bacterium]|nr:hypothetical protein [Chloroflexia bacterium]